MAHTLTHPARTLLLFLTISLFWLAADTSTLNAQTPLPPPVELRLSGDASPEFGAVATAVQDAMALYHVPGAAIGIYYEGREELATLGVSDVTSGEPVSAETRFQMGSVSKVYTATAVMRLVEEGKIDLDAPVSDYVPDLSLQGTGVADKVTVRDLLRHSGGWWGDAFVDTGSGDDAIERYVAEVLPRLPQVAPVREHFSYNNAGFVLLGSVIESVTGQDYREVIQDLILAPLTLRSATFDAATAISGPYAQGHGLGQDGAVVEVTPLALPRALDPAGGLWTTVGDQLAFARLHLDEEPDGVLDDESIAAMQTPQLPFSGQPGAHIALPWATADLGELNVVDHEGGTFGQTAKLTLIPDESFAIAVFTNSQGGNQLGQIALLEALRQYFDYTPESGSAGKTDDSGLPPTIEPVPVEQLRQYAGHYQVPVGAYDLSVEQGELVARYMPLEFEGQIVPSNAGATTPYPPMALDFVAQDIAILGGQFVVSFRRTDDGDVGWMVEQGRLLPRSP